jgi:hypothetical protein
VIKVSVVKQAANILISRLIPGLLNMAALLILAAWLSRSDYGIVSTFIVTSAVAGDMIFGPVSRSVLIHHSEHFARGAAQHYENLLLSNTVLLSMAVGLVGTVFVWAGIFDWQILAVTVAYGAYTAVQEISHARLQFYRFAVGSSAQSLIFLQLGLVMVRNHPTVSSALEAFALSYAIGALCSALLVRPRLSCPSVPLLINAFRIGAVPTFSSGATNLLNLACRYLMLFFGRGDALGIFSFSFDMASRGVGIFLNFATFALVPHALRKDEDGNPREMWKALVRGWVAAVAVCLLAAAAIIALATTHWIGALNRPVYDPVSFGLTCVAVIISRSSKMVLSPVAMRLRRTSVLLTPFLYIAPIAIALTAAGLFLRIPYAVELVYTVAFAAWAAISYRSFVPELGRGRPAEDSARF